MIRSVPLAFVVMLAACHHDGSVLDDDQGVAADGGSCMPAGAGCALATDCCNLHCDNGTCSATACISDGNGCSGNGDCCSTQCNGGTCAPLNAACKTAGNACPNGNGDCCSKVCDNGVCASPSLVSYCTQVGDICFHDSECCTGACEIASGATAGTCAQLATTCAVDGIVCNGCTGCCSSLCAPYGTSTSKICQAASGCHVTGDLCHTDSDCCGGDATQIGTVPGAGLIKCVPDPAHPGIGTCSTPDPTNCPNGHSCGSACVPEGDVCHYTGNGGCASNAIRNDCCDATGNKGQCKLDALGIPRCYGLTACVALGGECASSADCCGSAPCVPDSMGHLHCGAAMCVTQGGVCTTTGDCCDGLPCDVPAGMLSGTCEAMSMPTDGGTPACALFGQACSMTTPCCTNNGVCMGPSSAACAAGETDCTCFTTVL